MKLIKIKALGQLGTKGSEPATGKGLDKAIEDYIFKKDQVQGFLKKIDTNIYSLERDIADYVNAPDVDVEASKTKRYFFLKCIKNFYKR